MGKTTHVVEVQTKITGGKAVGTLGTKIKKTGVEGAAAGGGIAASFKAAKLAILSAVPALQTFSASLASSGIGLVVVALGALIGLFTKAGKKGAEFSKAISTLRAITSKTAVELETLSDQAKELGASTAFTAAQVVSLQTELAKLGFTVQEIENSTPAILDLAASLDISLAEAAAFAGSSVKAFGLDTKETQRLVDVFAKSTSASALDFNKLRESLKLVAPTAKAVGLSVEKTTALLAALADSGLAGSIAGTGLSKIFIELSKKGLTLDEALEKVGTGAGSLTRAIDLVGIVGGKSLLTLASTGSEDLEKLESRFLAAEGAAKALADTRLDNLAGDTTRLSSAWDGFLLNIEDGSGIINKLSRGAIQLLTNTITGFQNLITVTTFYLRDFWLDLKQRGFNAVTFAIGYFQKFSAEIKIFANKAKLLLSEIPLFGRAIDKKAIKKNIDEAVVELARAEELLERVRKEGDKRRDRANTRFLRFLGQRKKEKEALDELEKEEDVKEEVVTDAGETDEEKAARKKKLAAQKKFSEKLEKQREDLEANTDAKKIELARQRQLTELEQLGFDTTEKREKENEINKYFDELEAFRKKEQVEKDKVLKQKSDKEEEAQRKKKLQQNLAITDAIINGFGAETAAAKAALIIKNGLLLEEMAIEAKAAITKIALKNAEAGVSVGAGFIETLKAGFPQNVPLLILYALQASALVKGMIGATQKAKSAIPMGGGGGSVGINAPVAPTASAPPDFNVVGASATNQLAGVISNQQQTPIKTYVVANDVTTGQALERNIVQGATIG